MTDDLHQFTHEAWEANAEVWDARMGDEGNDFFKKALLPSTTTAVTVIPAAASIQSESLGQEQFVMAGESLAPSEVVILRGELFAFSAGVLNSWQLVGRETKVSGPPLAENMLATAFLALEQAGHVRLVRE